MKHSMTFEFQQRCLSRAGQRVFYCKHLYISGMDNIFLKKRVLFEWFRDR
jgi:hypothetical protein